MTTPAPTCPLSSLLAARAVWLTEPGFDQARQAWNLAIDQLPVDGRGVGGG
jgi:hypothetical protein